MLDLDQPAEGRRVTRHRLWRRWRRLISAAALLAVGAAVGAGLTHRWTSHRAALAADSTIAVAAVPGAFTWTGQADTSYSQAGDPRTVVSMAGWLSIVNAGPERVQLRALIFDQPGTTLYGNDVERWIAPLEGSIVEVAAEMQCQGSAPRDGRLSLTVATVNAKVRTFPAEWDGARWDDERDRACAESEAD